MENIKWIFDGIGTELIAIIAALIIGAAGGGTIGYKIGIKNKIKQKQYAGNNSQQVQIGSVNYNGDQQTKSSGGR